jgi:hypothetical protein
MSAISIAINRGVPGIKATDFTIGTAAPTASTDFELRFNTTDQNSNSVRMLDVITAIKLFRQVLETTGSNVNVISFPNE